MHPNQYDNQEKVIPWLEHTSPGLRLTAKKRNDRVQNPDLLIARLIIVNKFPNDAGGHKGNRHRHEDDRLGDLLVAAAVGQNCNQQPQAYAGQRSDEYPQQVVAQRRREQAISKNGRIVGQPDELIRGSIEEA
ncbi:hypothetical protein D3C77_400130 [compost metagenome]